MRHLLTLGTLAGLLLAGCAQPVPDSGMGAGSGVGFGDYASYELDRARREAQLTGAPGAVPGGAYGAPVGGFPAPVPVAVASLAPSPSGISATDLAAVGIGAAAPPVTSGPIGAAPPFPAAAPSAPAPGAVVAGATPVPGALPSPATVPGDAVASAGLGAPATDTASSAAAQIYGEGRLGAGQIAPGALPATSAARPEWSPQADPLRDTGLEAQPGNAAPVLVNAPAVAPVADAGPNIVEYALSAPNAVGQEYYSRFAFAREGRMQRNCADYRSADEAQRDFLLRGGPDRDARGLDPDGDGFACGWDPAPFRAAVGG